jgi:hypothetical protein
MEGIIFQLYAEYNLSMEYFMIPIILIDEHCFILIGGSTQDRLLIVSYMERNNAIRLISAREATLSERKAYEQY